MAGLAILAALGWLAGTGWQLQQPTLHDPQRWLPWVAALGGWVGWLLWRLRPAAGAVGGAHRAGGVDGAQAELATRGAPMTQLTLATLAAAVCALSALLAFATTEWRAAGRLADRLDPALEGVDLVLVGTVAGLPRQAVDSTRFVFEVASARTERGERVRGVPQRVSLGWFAASSERAEPPQANAASPRPRASERWQLVVRLKRPHGGMNPHGFDLERWLFEQRIGATGSVRPGSVRWDDGSAWPSHPVARTRERIRDAIFQAVPDPAAAGVVAALTIGDQSSIDSRDWEVFRLTGVAHLMSISGLHVTMFAWAAALAVGWLWRRRAGLMLRLPAPQAARWGGLLLALGYAVLAGWGVPAQRTVWMLAVAVALRSAGVHWPAPRVLLAAAWVVTLADPWALLQPGFWLSFVAVGVLIVADGAQSDWASHRRQAHGAADAPDAADASDASGVSGVSEAAGAAGSSRMHDVAWARAGGLQASTRIPGQAWRAGRGLWRLSGQGWLAIAGLLRTQAIATVGLAPLTLLLFQQLSLAGFVANLVAIPFVTLVVTPLSLLGVLFAPAWPLAAAGVQALMAMLDAMAAWPWAVWTAAEPPTWVFLAGSIGAALAVLPLPPAVRGLALPLMLPLAWPPVERPEPGRFQVVAADVGQGSAVLVRTRHHLLLHDAGPQYTPTADAGQRVLVPLLRGRGEHAVDMLVLSHQDADHIGGADALLDALPVREVRSSLPVGVPPEPPEPAAGFEPEPSPTRTDGDPGSQPWRGASAALAEVLQRIDPARHRPCVAGQSWSWDGVVFEMLHPLDGASARMVSVDGSPPSTTTQTTQTTQTKQTKQTMQATKSAAVPAPAPPPSATALARSLPRAPRPPSANASSCVLRVRDAQGASLLLTGDIEVAQERLLIERLGLDGLRSTVVIAPHHGSRTSSSAAFVEATSPSVVVFQAAYRSRFGHPAPDVVARWDAAGATLVRSDHCGAWTWMSGAPQGQCERERRRRYWHWREGGP